MSIELIMSSLILGVAAAFLAATVLSTQRAAALGVVVSGTALLAVVFSARAGLHSYPVPEASVENRPIEVPIAEYVSSDTCRACHPQEYASWRNSFHSSMTRVPSPETVIPDFNVELQDRYNYKLEQRGDEFWVDTDDPALGTRGQARIQRQVVMATGSHHAQIFWVETDHGRRLELIPFVYRIREQRWIPFLSAFLAPDSGGEVVETSWSRTCIKCHATHGRARVDGPLKSDAHVGEMGIACEACHGPAERHVTLNRDPLRRYGLHMTGEGDDPSIVQPAKLSHERSSEVCGPCHSLNTSFDSQHRARWLKNGPAYRPGDDLSDTKNVLRIDGEQLPYVQNILRRDPNFLSYTFWPDGEAAVSGREYNGLTESPCYVAGELSCFSCHTLHQTADDPRSPSEWADDQVTLGLEGSQACLQCHEDFIERVEAHTHHAGTSAGSECMNCHMPNTAYGLLKTTRSHKITNPSVASSLETGRPNACNLCHLNKTLEWTANAQEQWYGMPVPELSKDERQIAASLLWGIRGHAGQRALIAWAMNWEPARQASGADWMTPYLAQLLEDPYDAIRMLSDRALEGVPGYDDATDPFGPVAQLTRAKWLVMEGWSRRERGGQSSILIGADGALDEKTLARLVSERDDRLVFRPE